MVFFALPLLFKDPTLLDQVTLDFYLPLVPLGHHLLAQGLDLIFEELFNLSDLVHVEGLKDALHAKQLLIKTTDVHQLLVRMLLAK